MGNLSVGRRLQLLAISAIVGLIVTIFYKHRSDQRAESRHKVQMRKLMGLDEDEEA